MIIPGLSQYAKEYSILVSKNGKTIAINSKRSNQYHIAGHELSNPNKYDTNPTSTHLGIYSKRVIAVSD